jgi:hypothetical protein
MQEFYQAYIFGRSSAAYLRGVVVSRSKKRWTSRVPSPFVLRHVGSHRFEVSLLAGVNLVLGYISRCRPHGILERSGRTIASVVYCSTDDAICTLSGSD